MADILNAMLGTEYTESKFRKQRQIFDKMFSANQSKFADTELPMNTIAALTTITIVFELIKQEVKQTMLITNIEDTRSIHDVIIIFRNNV